MRAPSLVHSALAAVLGLGVGIAQAADTYTIDPGHSQVRFEYNHLGFSNIVGLIGEVSGEIVFDSADPSKSSVTATIPLTSIQTGYAKMNEHLEKDDFFDIAKYPEATFVSTAVESVSADRMRVSGDFSLHGVTRPVVLDVTLNKVGEHPMRKTPAIGFDASTDLMRSDYGLGKYTPAVGDAVKISITIEANGKAE